MVAVEVHLHVREVRAKRIRSRDLVALDVQRCVLLHVEARAERAGAWWRRDVVVVAVSGFEGG